MPTDNIRNVTPYSGQYIDLTASGPKGPANAPNRAIPRWLYPPNRPQPSFCASSEARGPREATVGSGLSPSTPAHRGATIHSHRPAFYFHFCLLLPLCAVPSRVARDWRDCLPRSGLPSLLGRPLLKRIVPPPITASCIWGRPNQLTA